MPDRPTPGVSSQVDIVAIITGPSEWQKAVSLYSASNLGSQFTISFPLELEQFDDLINTIEEELGFRAPGYEEENTYNLLIEARIYVTGNTGFERIDDTFVQPMKIKVGRGRLEWDNQLFLSERKTLGGFSYKHQGSFSYTLELEETSLYLSRTLTSDSYRPPFPIILPSSKVTFPEISDTMKANFGYTFRCDQPLRNLAEEVKITATLEAPEIWSKTFVLVPTTLESGDFGVDFSVDTNSFRDLVDKTRNEIGIGLPQHQLTIEAVVHTTADTDYGPIDDVFTQTLSGEMTASVIIWNLEPESSKPGSITRSRVIFNPDELIRLSVSEARIVFPSVAGIIFVSSLPLGIIYVMRRPVGLPELEKEARQAKRKHKGLIVDVQELPATGKMMVVSLSSLDDLINTAENLFKPVLHQAEWERHTYCVIYNTVRYEYVSGLETIGDEGDLAEGAEFM